uniref:Uncharacterized protein n=1 Tax=Candidatus Kentrum sp. FW TaxID=2126338 RepID=A0A450TY78_9GAMM|nr:MAG: hypothetical protein BECKFW1821C_GA0114237_10643 [Candidatus Kentron sp. FW]
MSEKSVANFIEKCLSGDARQEDIDDFVEQWHEGDGGLPLNEYLGMTETEYSLWVTNPETLSIVIDNHRMVRSTIPRPPVSAIEGKGLRVAV